MKKKKKESNTPTCEFLLILKTLNSLLRCVWFKVGAKLCRDSGPPRL